MAFNSFAEIFEKKENNVCLEFKELIKKTGMLFIILGACRKENKVTILPNKIRKYTKANRPLQALIYHHYPDNEKLCIVKSLQSYIGIRKTLVTREVKYLIISYRKPHKQVSSETKCRWIKHELSKAGVDTSVFQADSCRSASSSKTRDADVSISEILKKRGWKSIHTSKTFYSRDINILLHAPGACRL